MEQHGDKYHKSKEPAKLETPPGQYIGHGRVQEQPQHGAHDCDTDRDYECPADIGTHLPYIVVCTDRPFIWSKAVAYRMNGFIGGQGNNDDKYQRYNTSQGNDEKDQIEQNVYRHGHLIEPLHTVHNLFGTSNNPAISYYH
jgi:hypothetical protein